MIAIRDIIIFLSGVALVCVVNLTRNYLYGKYMSVSRIIQPDEAYKPRKTDTTLPEVDKGRLDRLMTEINTIDEFAMTHSRQAKERQ